MTLREILKQRAQRRQKLAESKRTSPRFPGRRPRRETVEERKMNRFIESRERMNRKHYVLVEDENNDDLVEIDSEDTDDTSIDTGADVSKDEIIKSLEELAAQVGMKVVPADDADAVSTDDIEGADDTATDDTATDDTATDDTATDDEKADESNEAAASAEATAATDQNAQQASTDQVTTEADDTTDDTTDDTEASAGDTATDDAATDDTEGDKPEDAEGDEGSDDDTTDDAEGDKPEDAEDVAKKLSELTPTEWLDILAQIKN